MQRKGWEMHEKIVWTEKGRRNKKERREVKQ